MRLLSIFVSYLIVHIGAILDVTAQETAPTPGNDGALDITQQATTKWKDAYDKADAFVSKLTLEEKVSIGIEYLMMGMNCSNYRAGKSDIWNDSSKQRLCGIHCTH